MIVVKTFQQNWNTSTKKQSLKKRMDFCIVQIMICLKKQTDDSGENVFIKYIF